MSKYDPNRLTYIPQNSISKDTIKKDNQLNGTNNLPQTDKKIQGQKYIGQYHSYNDKQQNQKTIRPYQIDNNINSNVQHYSIREPTINSRGIIQNHKYTRISTQPITKVIVNPNSHYMIDQRTIPIQNGSRVNHSEINYSLGIQDKRFHETIVTQYQPPNVQITKVIKEDPKVQIQKQSQWFKFYRKNQQQKLAPPGSTPPVVNSCCTPTLIGIVGLFILGGLITAIILASTYNPKTTTQKPFGTAAGIVQNPEYTIIQSITILNKAQKPTNGTTNATNSGSTPNKTIQSNNSNSYKPSVQPTFNPIIEPVDNTSRIQNNTQIIPQKNGVVNVTDQIGVQLPPQSNNSTINLTKIASNLSVNSENKTVILSGNSSDSTANKPVSHKQIHRFHRIK